MRKLNRKLLFAPLLLLACLPLMAATSCDSKIHQENDKASNQRVDNYVKATSLYPAPNQENFPLRQALVQMTEREDLINHPWYVYVFPPMSNQPLGYYVAKSVPQNICNFLSSTQGEDGYQAPSLDGIFYGGSGASNGCDAVFFFDYTTNAMIQIGKLAYFTTDQPLTINVPQLTVAPK